uniref:Drought induced 19 protein type zinc-binding domain-containing protein n=1 Tax=Leersia perrieri TaxID=77586 RepID=A0A0D9WJP5_9ORYZ
MDSEHWISRLAAAKRFYAAQLGHGGADSRRIVSISHFCLRGIVGEFLISLVGGADRAVGMEEMMDMDEEVRPELACPYCYEDHDVASLCAHLEEDHPFEPHAAPCPICSEKIAKDMLNHITVQHGYLFKVLLVGGGHRPSSNSSTTNISADPLLSSFGLSFPTSDAEETSKPPISIPDDVSMVKETPAQPWDSRIDSSLTSEEREQKRKQASVRATFVQDLLLTTLFGD